MNIERARAVLAATTNRDVLSLSQLGPLQKEAIVDSFRAQMLVVHPDKNHTDTIAPADKQVLDQAAQRLVEARDALLSLLSASDGGVSDFVRGPVELVRESQTPDCTQRSSPLSFGFPDSGSGFEHLYCSQFGCLRLLQTEEERESGVCAYCRRQPQKCKFFGCLAKSTDGYCARHKAAY